MLQSVPTISIQHRIWRLASHKSILDFLQEQGMNGENIDEMTKFLRLRNISDSRDGVIDSVFRPKPRSFKSRFRGRFSDGTFPVFYAALELGTANVEVEYWFRKTIGSPKEPRTGHYLRFSCNFNGTAKDLRSKKKEWTNLTNPHDYSFCNKLGAEALEIGIDGFLTPSARKINGTNTPVFSKTSLSNPGEYQMVALTYDPAADAVSMDP